MATPTTNFVGTANVNTGLLGAGRYVADGEKWDDGNFQGNGQGVLLDYSFPQVGFWVNPYGSSNEPWVGGINGTTALEQAAIRAALATWSRFANVTFVENVDTQFTVGELRFIKSSALPNNESAHGYFPSGGPQAGDVWFNSHNQFNRDGGAVPLGSFDYETILHEIGHTLGLKHTFDDANSGPANHAPATQDNYFYSIMSYTASPYSAHGNNFATFYPTTPMYLDLVAIEGMYGQRAFNTGNNIYAFYDGIKYWQAINDTGGHDKIVYVGSENSTINLNPGGFSAVSEAIAFHRPNGTTVTSRATVTIGPNVVIEDATGGNGHDTLIGNGANNILAGGNGNDTLSGLNGADYLTGGNGNDRFFGSSGNDKLIGGAGADHFYFNTGLNASTNRDTIMDYNLAQDSLHLENAIFTRLAVQAHLNPAYFRAASHALDRNDFIVYNRGTGGLFYDPNGSLAGGQVLFAVLLNKPALTASEFSVF